MASVRLGASGEPAELRPVDVNDSAGVTALAVDVHADLVVIGPEVAIEAGLADVRRGPLPALVVCHGGSIRRVLAARRPEELSRAGSLPNGVLVEVGDDG